MKSALAALALSLVLLTSGTASATLSPYPLFQGHCLALIESEITALGTSPSAKENVASLELVQSAEGDIFEVMYYRWPQNTVVTGYARIKLSNQKITLEPGYVVTTSCTVDQVTILGESAEQ
jgi:hypothetical protein